MTNRMRFSPLAAAVYGAALLITCATTTSLSGQIAIRGDKVFTMAGDPIANGVVIITDGKIAQVGAADDIRIPQGYQVLTAKVVTPGLIDAHATAGLTGMYNQPHDQDQQDRSGPIQPEMRAIDAINIREELIGYLRGFGVTTLHTGHGASELMSGQTLIVKTIGDTAEQAVVVDGAAVLATIGPQATRGSGSPGTRGKQISMLRQELIKAQEYQQKIELANRTNVETNAEKESAQTDREQRAATDQQDGSKSNTKSADPPSRDLRLEALVDVLSGKRPLLVTANRAQDIASALRLAEEFKFRMWLDGAAEAYLMIPQIKQAAVPVILHPTMIRAGGDYENLSFETASKLVEAGIPVAMQSGYEGYVPKVRVVLFEAALTAAHGLTFEQALATITVDAAKILGISERVGTLEVGKDADIAMYDGDPFEYATHCVGVLINGTVVSDKAN